MPSRSYTVWGSTAAVGAPGRFEWARIYRCLGEALVDALLEEVLDLPVYEFLK